MAYVKEKFSLTRKCLMCEGNLEKSNIGNICNACRDKLRR